MMTEPAVASSDATNVTCSVVFEGDEPVINGRKWWITGAAHPLCQLALVMGKSSPDAESHRQQSIVLVPFDTPGLTVLRDLDVFGFQHREGHCEVLLESVRVPATSLLGGPGDGFKIAQTRLGPGRVHHCMRALGAAERGLQLLCARGAAAARKEIAAIKIAAPSAALNVLDRAIQVHGAGGLCSDFPLAAIYAHLRTLRILDGPDEVHRRAVGSVELREQRAAREDLAVGPRSSSLSSCHTQNEVRGAW